MVTVRRLRELRKTLIILKLFQIFKEDPGFQAVQLSLTGRMTSAHCLFFKKMCHVTWMQSQLLRHPERWGMCRRCPSIQNML